MSLTLTWHTWPLDITNFMQYNTYMAKKRRNWLELKLDEYNHTMELIRTVLPICILIIQVVILVKLT